MSLPWGLNNMAKQYAPIFLVINQKLNLCLWAALLWLTVWGEMLAACWLASLCPSFFLHFQKSFPYFLLSSPLPSFFLPSLLFPLSLCPFCSPVGPRVRAATDPGSGFLCTVIPRSSEQAKGLTDPRSASGAPPGRRAAVGDAVTWKWLTAGAVKEWMEDHISTDNPGMGVGCVCVCVCACVCVCVWWDWKFSFF